MEPTFLVFLLSQSTVPKEFEAENYHFSVVNVDTVWRMSVAPFDARATTTVVCGIDPLNSARRNKYSGLET